MSNNISLKDFLKKYTAISSKFINEYYKFYEMCENNVFGINAEDIIKFLGITFPKKFYERLREKYIINSDYIIIRNNQQLTKGIRDANYFVSFDAFKKICMVSRT
jgi:phage anti-repressor protein